MGEPAESTLIMADREQKEEPVIKEDTISLSVKLPNGLPYLLPMLRASETVQHLKQLVLEMPEFCHITSCHLEAIVPVVDTDLEKKKKKKTPSVILHESKLLSECSELREGYCLKVVCDGYTRQGIVEHINRLRWIIANPRTPFTNVGMVDSVENNTDSPERVEETKGDTKHVSIEENDVPSSDSREQHKLTSNDPDLLRRKLKNERKEMLQKLKKEIIPVPITLEAFFPGDEQESNGLDASTLSGIEWKDDSKNILCFESISFSGWNPPPRCRELVGDLAYIQVNAAESNAVFHVTATFDGFYVNASRHQVFNPEPSRNPFHSRTMVELLQKISPSFKKNFSLLFEEAARKEKEMESKSGLGQFDLVTLGVTAKPDETFNDAETQRKTWLKPMKCPNLSHSFDLNRSYEGVHDGYGIVGVERGMLRDWNDEYQLCIEMPSVTIEEKMQRCAAIDRIQKEFVEAAINAVRGILNGHIPPINPDDPPHVHAYVYNQIFISLASFRSDDTTVASYSASNQDLLGVKSLNEAMEVIRARESAVTRKKMSESAGVDQPIPGREKKKASLHTLATVLIDSLGCRFIAQSIIPGILQNEQNDLLVYGSVDYGQTVKSEADAHGLWQNAVEPWYIGKSDMMIQGKEISLFAPVECKGIRGSDDRIYALDLLRLTPFDLNYYEHRSEYHNKSGEIEIDVKTASRYLALLRPELIQLYARYRELENQQKQILEHKEKMSKSKTNKDQHENASEKAGAPAAETNSNEARDTDSIEIEPIEPMRIDLNVFTSYPQAENDEKQKSRQYVQQLSSYLVEVRIPHLIEDIRKCTTPVVDGDTLTRAMHSNGINMRYLPRIALEALSLEGVISTSASAILLPMSRSVYELCEIEMISRSVKWIIRADNHSNVSSMKRKPAVYIADLLNKLFQNSDQLWSRLFERMEQHYNGFVLKIWGPQAKMSSRAYPLVLLRRVCQINGIVVKPRNYDFTSLEKGSSIFLPNDIVDIVPVCKSSIPEWPIPEARDCLETAKVHLAQKDFVRACERANEALTLVSQVASPAHITVATCCSFVGTILHHLNDPSAALVAQKRCLALLDRLALRDNVQIAHAHNNVGMLYHYIGQTDKAIPHLRRSLYLLELLGGPFHYESSALYLKMASVYTQTNYYEMAVKCVKEALCRAEGNEFQEALCRRSYAQILAAHTNDFQQAFKQEKLAYDVYKRLFGPKHPRTKEIAQWMEAYLRQSVKGKGSTVKR